VVPREGLRFPPDDVHPQDVDPETAAALVATGVYVIAEPVTAPIEENADAG
jgi:hypothetical protein